MKATVLLNKLLIRSWFHEIFFWWENFRNFHTLCTLCCHTFWEKFREINGFTKVDKELISRKKTFGRREILFFPHTQCFINISMFESCFTFTEKIIKSISNPMWFTGIVKSSLSSAVILDNKPPFFWRKFQKNQWSPIRSLLSCSYSTEQRIQNWKIDTFVSNLFVFTDFFEIK